jgi:hypothetical protein
MVTRNDQFSSSIGLTRAHEGKSHCRIKGHQLLCNKFMTGDMSEFPISGNWSFVTVSLTLLWNLISRTEQVDCLMLQHFVWEGGAMTIEEQDHKADEAGENKFGKRIYQPYRHGDKTQYNL